MKEVSHWANRPLISIVFAHGHEQINHYLTTESGNWDVVLLDGDMPLMSGVDVAQQFLSVRNIPVIIVSMNPFKVQQMLEILQEYETPCVAASITNPHLIVDELRRIYENRK